MGLSKYKLGDLIQESLRKNDDLIFDVSFVRGISNNKQIVETKATVDDNVIRKFYIVNPGEFVYNPRTTRMGDKLGLAYNDTATPLLFSFNTVLSLTDMRWLTVGEAQQNCFLLTKCVMLKFNFRIFLFSGNM